MSDNLSLVVRRKYHLKKDDVGIVDIICNIDSNKSISTIDLTEFPSCTVFISKGYDSIENEFQPDELFILEHVDRSTDNQDFETSADKADHWSLGKYAKKLDTKNLIPIINSELPNMASGLLNYVGALPNGQFLISNSNYVYGPFLATAVSDDIIATPNHCLPLSLPPHFIAKISLESLREKELYIDSKSASNHGDYGLITAIASIKDISIKLKDQFEIIDYISNSQLISFFARNGLAGSKTILSKKPAEALKDAINEDTKRKQKLSGNQRLQRLESILDDYLKEPDFGWPIVNRWLGSKEGADFLQKLVIKNPEIASSHTADLNYQKDQLDEEISILKVEKRKYDSELSGIKAQVLSAQLAADEQINEIRQTTEKKLQEERKKVMANLEEQIQDKRNTVAETDKNLSDLQDKLKINLSYEELVEELKYLKRQGDELKLEITNLEKLVKEQEDLLKAPNLTTELVKTNTILGLLQGRDFSNKNSPQPYTPPVLASTTPENGASIIQAISNEFEEGGRSFTFEEMANLLIIIQQSFMTVLKGLPGAGKTSTAIRLAQAHRITESSSMSDNFLNIPVSRGWVSGRDFIGFHNSLRGSYQPSKTGLYQFLQHGKESGADSTLRLALLDEANLSPIEHYMSDFLGLFDPEGRDRPIDTGITDPEERFINIPKNLRFIATINNDATTETLSPRLCDRVPIISMDIHNLQGSNDVEPFNLDGAIDYELLHEYFGQKEKESYDDLPTKIQVVIDLFEERNKEFGSVITVSKRKRTAMKAFYEVAKYYMDDTIATDFAVSQYMLPLINGFGDKYRQRLDKIREQAHRTNLMRTDNLLENILTNGDTHIGSYSFF